jgi:putative exosortase-associated protein (TIGR04073 family)
LKRFDELRIWEGKLVSSKKLSVCAVALVFVLSVLSAAISSAEETATVRTLSKRMSAKFARGVVNAATGYGEMVRCPMETGRRYGVFLGATWGVLKGISMTVFREVGGVCEAALFFYPLPGNYDPLFDAPLVFSKSRSGDGDISLTEDGLY